MRRCSHRSGDAPAPPIILQISRYETHAFRQGRPPAPLDDDKKEGAEGEGEDDKRRSTRRQPTRRLRRNPPSADGWGDRYSPSWRERSPPIRTASPAARNRSRWATASAIHGAGWRLSTGERRRKLRLSYFLSPAQKRVSALLGRAFFLHYHPPYGWGVIMWLWGAIITLSPTHSRRAKRAYAQPALFVLRTDAERREARTR